MKKKSYNWVRKHKFLKNQILNLKEILHKAPIDILCIDKNKLDEIFQMLNLRQKTTNFPLLEETEIKKGVGKWFLLGKN